MRSHARRINDFLRTGLPDDDFLHAYVDVSKWFLINNDDDFAHAYADVSKWFLVNYFLRVGAPSQ